LHFLSQIVKPLRENKIREVYKHLSCINDGTLFFYSSTPIQGETTIPTVFFRRLVMTPEQIKLVQDSFEVVKLNAQQAAQLFYNRLFDLNPNLRSLFSGNMVEQGRKLMSVLATAIASLNNLEKIVPVVQELGKRHHHYGVTHQDYDTVGQALIWTLEQGLAEKFDAVTKAAWLEVYGLLSTVMKEAAAKAA